MHVLPMMMPPGVRDGWHRVTGPGGYEIWRVTAEERGQEVGPDERSRGGVRVEVAMGVGHEYQAAYQRAYEAYRRRPTRVAPPVPGDHPWVALHVWREGQVLAAWERPVPVFAASADELDVQAGGNRVVRQADGRLRLAVRNDAGLSMELMLRPVGTQGPVEVAAADGAVEEAAAVHGWVVSAGLCEVEGRIEGLAGGDGLAFQGTGHCDYRWGTRPPAERMRWWIWGWVPESAAGEGVRTLFWLGQTQGGRSMARVVEADASGVRAVAAGPVEVESGGRGAAGARGREWPMRVRVGEVLELSGGRIIGGSGATQWLSYDVVARRGTATAYCDFTSPPHASSFIM